MIKYYFFQYWSTNSFLMFTSSGLKYLLNKPQVTSSIFVVYRLTSIASNWIA